MKRSVPGDGLFSLFMTANERSGDAIRIMVVLREERKGKGEGKCSQSNILPRAIRVEKRQ